MGTSNPSRSRSKGSPVAAGKAGVGKAWGGKATVHLVTLTLGKGAAPLMEMRGGELVVTDTGSIVSETWRTLGEGRSDLETEAFSMGPYSLRGVLRIKSSDTSDSGLPSAIRLLKARSARAVRATQQGNGVEEFESSGIWKRGYAEKSLVTLKQVVEARKSLGR